MDLATLPLVLKQLEIRTLMIEGGSSIIDQVLEATRTNPDGLKKPLADSIIVTIAPVNVGADGTGYSIGSGFEAISSAYQRKSSQKFGKDNVLAFTNSFALSA
jgi:2,5-diamino-6-(ribosylamino)-4(3H)-pyrimidinone 5'-phosphate reductase